MACHQGCRIHLQCKMGRSNKWVRLLGPVLELLADQVA